MKMKTIKWSLTKQQTNVFKNEFDLGYSAGSRGVSFQSCPHKNGTIAYDGWARGWKAAKNTLKT